MGEPLAEVVQGHGWLPEKPYTYVQVRARLEEIIGQFPDGHCYIRPGEAGNGQVSDATAGCYYWHDIPAEPGCLIGRLLHRVGVPDAILTEMDRDTVNGSTIAIQAFLRLKGMFTVEAVDCLQHLQSYQDMGRSWRQAMESMESFRSGYRRGGEVVRRQAMESESP